MLKIHVLDLVAPNCPLLTLENSLMVRAWGFVEDLHFHFVDLVLKNIHIDSCCFDIIYEYVVKFKYLL